ncbi:hypothetical protein K488DRAFT_64165, partial [Vararia minispora EC-137]
YGTPVGECGLLLSGREKQCLAVARVLLKDPSTLLFDEAMRASGFTTPTLDAAIGAGLVQNLTASLLSNRRTSIITHRLLTVVQAGASHLCAQDDAVVEQRAHAELLRRGGLYRAMWVE